MKEIKIIDTDLSGRGIGKIDGKAVFIKGAVTGDVVLYETVESKKRYDIGKLCKIITPSNHRITPLCPVFENCGGCSFLHIDRQLESDIKIKAVEAAFRRAGIGNITPEKILTGKNTGYRNKAVFHLNNDGLYGFYESESRIGTSCEDCLLIPDSFAETVKNIEELIENESSVIPPENIMLREGKGKIMLVAEVKNFGQCSSLLKNIFDSCDSIVSVYECIGYPLSHEAEFNHLHGIESIITYFAGLDLKISPKSFFQVNTEIAEMMCSEICDHLDPKSGDTILDLYCGIGTIGLTVAKRFPYANVIGVEINENAVTDAQENCTLSGIANAEFICSDAGRINLSNISPYTAIVDPPRYGLTDTMISGIIDLSPEILVYMSCNPSTLAGDSVKLIGGGYCIDKVIAGDMFPGCPHIESLVFFKKNKTDA